MGCDLEDYRARVGTWAVGTVHRAQGGKSNGQVVSVIVSAYLCAAVLAVLLVIGGVEQNPGPVVEGESFLQVMCSGCERSLKSGTQCDTCGRWFHNGCGNVKAQLVDSGKWNCERCKWERFCLLEEKLKNALIEIEDLKLRNNKLEEQLRAAATGKKFGRCDTEQELQEGEQCLVLGDSIVRNVGTEQNMTVECFPGIRTEQLHRVMENRKLGSPDTVILHVGTNDLKQTANLDYVMGEVYSLVNKAKVKFPKSKIVLSGVLRRADVSWRRIGALNDRYDWIARTLGVTFVDPNSWLEEWDFARDGLHINRRGATRLGQLYSRVSGLGGRRKKME